MKCFDGMGYVAVDPAADAVTRLADGFKVVRMMFADDAGARSASREVDGDVGTDSLKEEIRQAWA